MTKQSGQGFLSRRSLIKFGAGTVGAGTIAGWLGTNGFAQNLKNQLNDAAIAAEPVDKVKTNDITPDQALQRLLDGNKRFVEQRRKNPNQEFARLTEVAQDQKPFAAILGCADSRVTPEIVFDQGIGDLFVVRVAGNISTTEDIASEEFGTLVLGAKILLVLGHERCGAVKAALKGGEYPGMIGSLVYAIKPAVDASEGKPGDRLENAIKTNILLQTKRLQTSPVIFKLVQQGKLKVVGGYYDLDTGIVSLMS
jgi:carbonic anhydrase